MNEKNLKEITDDVIQILLKKNVDPLAELI